MEGELDAVALVERYGDHLLRQVVAQRVAAQGDNDSFTHVLIIPPVLQQKQT